MRQTDIEAIILTVMLFLIFIRIVSLSKKHLEYIG